MFTKLCRCSLVQCLSAAYHLNIKLIQQVSGFIYELERRPVCKRGYSVGARTAPRFPKPSHVSLHVLLGRVTLYNMAVMFYTLSDNKT